MCGSRLSTRSVLNELNGSRFSDRFIAALIVKFFIEFRTCPIAA
jgi:hypothetical protein